MPISVYNWQQPDTSVGTRSLLQGMQIANDFAESHARAQALREKNLSETISKLFADRRASESAQQKHELDVATKLRQDQDLQAKIDHWHVLEKQNKTRLSAGSEPFVSPFGGTDTEPELPATTPDALDTSAIPSELEQTGMGPATSLDEPAEDLPAVFTNGTNDAGPETLIPKGLTAPQSKPVDYAAEIVQASREAERIGGLTQKTAPNWIKDRAAKLAQEKRMREKPAKTDKAPVTRNMVDGTTRQWNSETKTWEAVAEKPAKTDEITPTHRDAEVSKQKKIVADLEKDLYAVTDDPKKKGGKEMFDPTFYGSTYRRDQAWWDGLDKTTQDWLTKKGQSANNGVYARHPGHIEDDFELTGKRLRASNLIAGEKSKLELMKSGDFWKPEVQQKAQEIQDARQSGDLSTEQTKPQKESPKQIVDRIKAAGGTKEDATKALRDAGYQP